MKSRLSSKDAKIIMGAIGALVMLGLADLEDFISVMLEVDDHSIMEDGDHIDYLTSILRAIEDDGGCA